METESNLRCLTAYLGLHNLASYAYKRLPRAHGTRQPRSSRATAIKREGKRKHMDEAYDSLPLLLGLLGRHVGFPDDGDDLAEHDGGVAVEERDAREALAVLERVDHHRLLRAEGDLRHLVGLERVRRLRENETLGR